MSFEGTRRVAVVDIGTNTLKFSVTEISANGTEEVIHAHADTVRLGTGIATTGMIDPLRIERALASLKAYEVAARSLGAGWLIGVATAALRMASNGVDLIERIASSTGWTVRIVSGIDEALLTFNGLGAHLPAIGEALVADVGGGSTELIAVRNRSLLSSESVELGSGTLADRCFTQDPPGVKAVLQAVDQAAETLGHSSVIHSLTGPTLYLSGGNGQFLQAVAGWDEVAIPFIPSEFDSLAGAIAVIESSAIAQFLGIAQERARMLAAGVAIARAIISVAGPPSVTAVPSGIRGGLIAEWIATQQCLDLNQPGSQS